MPKVSPELKGDWKRERRDQIVKFGSSSTEISYCTIYLAPCSPKNCSANCQEQPPIAAVCAADGMSHCYLPRWVEDSESSKTRGSPPNQVGCQPLGHSVQFIKARTAQSPEVSPSRVHRIMARLLILLCCIPPPPTFSSLHRDDCQLCLCPCSTAFCSALCCCK